MNSDVKVTVLVELELTPSIMSSKLDAKANDLDDLKSSLKEELEVLEKFGIKFLKFKDESKQQQ